MKNNLFRGVTTALITPFQSDLSVDYEGLRSNVRQQIAAGVHTLLPLGTTGETPTLQAAEQEKIVQIVLQEARQASRPVKVLLGVGTNSTAKTVANARQAQAWGVDGLLVVTPYYNKPTQEGIYQHFRAINEAASLPIMVYNIKGRTGVNIETDTMARLAELEQVVAVKEASGDINQMMDVIQRIPELAVYSGDDALAFPLMCLGGQGVVSVVSNLLPGQVVRMTEAALQGDTSLARNLHYELMSIFKAAFIETNPAPVKYAMTRCGLAGGPLRLPLVEISPASQKRLDAVLQSLGLIPTA